MTAQSTAERTEVRRELRPEGRTRSEARPERRTGVQPDVEPVARTCGRSRVGRVGRSCRWVGTRCTRWSDAARRWLGPRGRLAMAGDAGMATAEYAIATIAAAGFAGLLVVVLRSDEVRELLTGLVRTALSM